jgi:hypothetical protein
MRLRSKILAKARQVVILCCALSAVGALASVFVILVRVPALSSTKLDELVGTLAGTACALLFAVMALLVNLTYMVYRANSLPGGAFHEAAGSAAGD